MADLTRFNAQQLAEFDREVQEFRAWYLEATPDDRSEFRSWLEDLAPIAIRQPSSLAFTLLCRVNNYQTDDEGNEVYNGVVWLTPKAMLGAITAWDAGDEFLPSHWMETL
ncbi:hypothetical protein Poly51_59320 [Rubripirellula tenax]|uniref:Uncharacterized protein n=2 Tax=Rubripirellula TaxID=1579505 RepID=A0A5C6E4S3_9BACT|nr:MULTISPECIES: hypothetical protein [Rubripirellula]TWU44476.1 hypothetical protein Poly59_61480 [Rubripirellula reticaptiva]TWU44663.1 hypothetical protein Poly51_59320 [Rubripirellula tenax]